MEVGDYVRFDYHRVTVPIQIARITEAHYHITDEDDNVCYSTNVGLVISESNLVKEPSLNIMDLIEKNDYINGLKVIQMYSPEGKYTIWIKLSDNTFIDNSEDIKSIVTHEQFESMQYNLESEVN